MWQAAAGFLITGVGLPLLGVAALGISRQDGLLELRQPGGEKIRTLFYLRPVSDDRPVFCHTECATYHIR